MACVQRENTGTCKHFQCPFPDESGYECVELFAYCEVGEGCVERCPYSYKIGNHKARRISQRALLAKYPEALTLG